MHDILKISIKLFFIQGLPEKKFEKLLKKRFSKSFIFKKNSRNLDFQKNSFTKFCY